MHFDIGMPAPDFTVEAYQRDADEPVAIELDSYRGRWLVLFFYPADFTFICPTELRDFAERQDDFDILGADVLAASTDGYHTHRAWLESDPSLDGVRFPIVADRNQALARAYGVLDTDGTARRATFVIDDEGLLRHMSVNADSVGRSAEEILRVVSALQTGEKCPAGWRPGMATLGLPA